MDQQPYITVSVAHLRFLSCIYDQQHRYDSSIPCKVVWLLQKDKEQPRRKKLHRMNQRVHFLESSFSNRDSLRVSIQFRGKRQSQHHFLEKMIWVQEQTHPFLDQQHQCYKLFKRTKLSFFNIEINNLLLSRIYSVHRLDSSSEGNSSCCNKSVT